MTHLIERLPLGPLDIIGDIHGEIEALEDLLARLGYDADGTHPAGRTLAFVGDLIDRGPDSPAVIERVMRFASRGNAQCILGNHELNLLRGAERDGNAWFMNPEAPSSYPAKGVEREQKPQIERFLSTLPLALARDDLRIVHACWHDDSLQQIHRDQRTKPSVIDLYRHYDAATQTRCDESGLTQRSERELAQCGYHLNDKDVQQPAFLRATAEWDTACQAGNPIRILTSGKEEPAAQPFWAGGKWRMVHRVKWWETYDDPTPVIVGHYWRRYSEAQTFVGDKDGPDVFDGIEPHHWMGKLRNVYCVDFSVGGRPAERRSGAVPPYLCKLAALRVPEWEVMHDDGEVWEIGRAGRADD